MLCLFVAPWPPVKTSSENNNAQSSPSSTIQINLKLKSPKTAHLNPIPISPSTGSNKNTTQWLMCNKFFLNV